MDARSIGESPGDDRERAIDREQDFRHERARRRASISSNGLSRLEDDVDDANDDSLRRNDRGLMSVGGQGNH